MKKNQMRFGKKLWVEISPEFYILLQTYAKQRNITFTKYINRALLRYSIKEELYEDNKTHVNETIVEKL